MAVTVEFGWEQGQTPTALAANVADYGRRLLAAILDLARVFAARIESWAKTHAPWTDDTTNARSGLTARAFPTAVGAVIVLAHTVEYGIWLELAHAGRFAVIGPALNVHYPQLLAALRRLVA